MDESSGPPLEPHQRIGYAVAVVSLILGAGLMSGLTLGLLSMDVLDLQVLRAVGSERERKAATRLLSLVSRPHWLLVTLLVCNAACLEALPLFMNRLLDPATTLVLSVTAVLLFGEILPQAVCSRYGVAIGAATSPVVRMLMWLCAPIAWPLGKLLDALLGHSSSVMQRHELKAMVELHGTGAGLGGRLSPQEIKIIHGVLDLTGKTALEVMLPLDTVFMLSSDAVLDAATMQHVLESGHSRVPVCRGGNRQDVMGLVLVKSLLQHWRSSVSPMVSTLQLCPMLCVAHSTPLFELLRIFQSGSSHMALLLAPVGADIQQLRQTRKRQSKSQNLGKLDEQQSSNHGACKLDATTTIIPAGSGSNVSSVSLSAPGIICRFPDGSVQQPPVFYSERNVRDLHAQWTAQQNNSRSGCITKRLSSSIGGVAIDMDAQQQQNQQQRSNPFASIQLVDMQDQAGNHGANNNEQLVPVGIVTLEDVLEELLQADILDETDTSRLLNTAKTAQVEMQHPLLEPMCTDELQQVLRGELLAAAGVQTSAQAQPHAAGFAGSARSGAGALVRTRTAAAALNALTSHLVEPPSTVQGGGVQLQRPRLSDQVSLRRAALSAALRSRTSSEHDAAPRAG